MKYALVLVLAVLMASCAVRSHQFADAVQRGDVQSAQNYFSPEFKDIEFSLVGSPDKYTVPMQYAILQKNKPMAKFLVENDVNRRLEGHNLAYYCAANNYHSMANYFVSIGEGTNADIAQAKQDIINRRHANNRSSLIALRILAALIIGST